MKWTKIWKKDGSVRETRKHTDGTMLSERNNVSQWLNKLRYRYVPAIKGQEYFSNLMGELHDVLNAIHANELAPFNSVRHKPPLDIHNHPASAKDDLFNHGKKSKKIMLDKSY